MWFFIVLGIVIAAAVVWRLRVKLVAKALGQPESRIDRHLNGPGH